MILSKIIEFDLVGRTEKVRALFNINLNDSSDFYPVKKYTMWVYKINEIGENLS